MPGSGNSAKVDDHGTQTLAALGGSINESMAGPSRNRISTPGKIPIERKVKLR